MLISTLILLLLVGFASATVEIDGTNVVFEADYSDFDNKDCDDAPSDCEDYVTSDISFSVNNTDASEVTIVVSASGLPSGYIANDKEVVLSASATTTVAYSIKVAHDKDAGEAEVGVITITDKNDSANINSKPLRQKTLSMLEFTKLEVDYTSEDNSEDDNFDGDNEEDTDWDLAEKAIPGEEITFTFKYENLFDNDYRYGDFDEVLLTIDDKDGLSDDIDDEWDLGSLNGGIKETFEITFVPEDDAEGSYELEITFEAEDEESVSHEIIRTLNLEVERVRDDVRIDLAEPTATIYACDENFQFAFEMKNHGKDKQRYTGVSIYNAELGINENIQDIELEEYDDRDDSWERLFIFDLNNIEANRYQVDVRTYIDRDEEMDSEIVPVDILACPSEDDTVTDTTPDDEIDTGDDTNQQEDNVDTTTTPNVEDDQEVESDATQVGSSEVVSTVENPYTTEDFFIATIIVAFVLIVAMIVIFIVMLLK